MIGTHVPNLRAAAGWRNAAGAAVRGELRFARDDRGFPGPFGSNPIGAYSGIDLISHGKDDRWGASLAGNIPSGQRVRTSIQVAWNRDKGDFVSPFSTSTSGSRRATGRFQTDITAGAGVDLSVGAEFESERATSTYIADDHGEIPIDRSVQGYFSEARWKAAGRLFVTAGLRIDDIHRDPIGALDDPYSPRPAMPADAVVSVNPKIAAAYFLSTASGSETKVRAAAGTGIRPPDGFELAFTDNPFLKPERSRSVEAGIDQAFASGRGLVEATWFRNNFDDLIVAVGRFVESSRYRTDNISNARAQGLELATTLRTRASGFDLQSRVGYTFLDTEILAVDGAASAPSPFTVGQSLLNRPRHQWTIDAGLARSAVSAWIRGGGRGRVLTVEPSYGTFGGLFDAAGYAVMECGRVVADLSSARDLRSHRKSFRSPLRGSVRLSCARPRGDGGDASCCKPLTSSSAIRAAPPCFTASPSTCRPAASSGILGPNGSGKTTLLRALAGVIQPSRGQVRLDGVKLADVPKRALAMRMAVVPQETHLAFDYTVLEVVMMGRYPHLGDLRDRRAEQISRSRARR